MIATPFLGSALGQDLATELANPQTRGQAVAAIAASGRGDLPLLLKLSEAPPVSFDDVAQQQLDVGLARAFGRLRATEAIPFLIKHINLDVDVMITGTIWVKGTTGHRGKATSNGCTYSYWAGSIEGPHCTALGQAAVGG